MTGDISEIGTAYLSGSRKHWILGGWII